MQNKVILPLPHGNGLAEMQTFAATLRALPARFSVHPQAFLVGGSVRDILLGTSPTDLDVEVYGLSQPHLHTLLCAYFPETKIDYFAQFGVWKIRGPLPDLSFSLPRIEDKVQSGHRGFAITLQPNLSKRIAVKRRDFTINALLANPTTGRIYDYVKGVQDLTNKLLRAVDVTTLSQDPLRVWRALQCIGRFNLTVESKTNMVLQNMSQTREATLVSKPRIREELDKLFSKAVQISPAFLLANEWGLLQNAAPQLYRLSTKKDWGQILAKMDRAVGKATPQELLVRRWHYMLKALSPREAKVLLTQYNFPKSLRLK